MRIGFISTWAKTVGVLNWSLAIEDPITRNHFKETVVADWLLYPWQLKTLLRGDHDSDHLCSAPTCVTGTMIHWGDITNQLPVPAKTIAPTTHNYAPSDWWQIFLWELTKDLSEDSWRQLTRDTATTTIISIISGNIFECAPWNMQWYWGSGRWNGCLDYCLIAVSLCHDWCRERTMPAAAAVWSSAIVSSLDLEQFWWWYCHLGTGNLFLMNTYCQLGHNLWGQSSAGPTHTRVI